MVGRDRAAVVEGERDRAVAVRRDRRHPVAEVEGGARERGRDRDRQLRVAADDVVALVGGAVNREVARARFVPEQVDQVQRRLVLRLGAVFLVVGGLEQRAHRRGVAAGDVVLDPVVQRQLVEELPGGRGEVVERRIARRLHLALERVVHGLEVVARLRERVVGAEDPERVLRSVRLRAEQVDRRELEPLRELEDRLVVRVDQLAAELGLLAVRPKASPELRPVGVHPAPEPTRRLVDVRGDALVLQRQRRRQPGDAAADDRDSRSSRRARRPCERHRPGHRDRRAERTGSLHELAAADPRVLLPLAKLLHLDPELRRSVVLACEALQGPHQRCPRHFFAPLFAVWQASTIQQPRSMPLVGRRRGG